MQYLLVGNYGVGNLGDEALKEYFLKTFPHVQWNVLSAHPQKGEYARFPTGVRSFISFSWFKTLRALLKSDGMVFGGGSLFTDTESVKAPIIWWIHAVFARIFRKKIILAFQGIGPLKSGIGNRCTHSVLGWATSISVRDSASKKRCESLVENKNIIQSFDPVFCLIKEDKGIINTKNVFTIIPRFSSADSFKNRALELLNLGNFDEVHILSMQPDDEKEKKCIREIQSSLSLPVSTFEVRTLEELVRRVSVSSFIYTQRYHGALVALALGKDFAVLPQKEGDKLDQIFLLNGGRKEHCEKWMKKGEEELRKVLV